MMKSKLTRCTSTRRAHHLISGMLQGWCMDCTGSLGASPGLGDVDYGIARVRAEDVGNSPADWPYGYPIPEELLGREKFYDCTPENVPNISGLIGGDGQQTVELTLEETSKKALGRSHLLPLEHAVAVAKQASVDCLAELGVRMARMQSRTHRASRFRAWASYAMAARHMAKRLAQCEDNLLKSCYPVRAGKKGVQRISVRSVRGKGKKPLPRRGWFRYNGKPAYRAAVGRPLLPEAEWLRRYWARAAKRRKTAQTRRKRRTVKSAPAGKFPRPNRIQIRPGEHNTVSPRNVYLGQVGNEQPDDFFTPGELDEVLIASTFPDGPPDTAQV